MYIDLVSHFAPNTMISESLRALRTNVLFAGEGEKARTIAVTSSYPREGKSMVSVNLAISLAQAGLKTLLAGVDFKSPVIGDFFSIEAGPGLTEVLLGKCPWEETLNTVTDMFMGKMTLDDLMLTPGLDNLNIITSGSIPSNPTELINSDRFTEFIDTVKQEYDIIILDTSPVLTNADTTIIGVKVDAILIVHQPGIASKEALKRTFNQLKQFKSKILGVVLNNVKPDLIPDALKNKYSEHRSADKVSVKEEVKAEKDKKKNLLLRALILSAVLIILISAILWQMGIIYPEKNTQPETEAKKTEEIPAIVEPAKKDIIPEKKADIEKGVTPYTDEIKQEESPVPVIEETKIDEEEKVSPPKEIIEKIKPEYKEKTYPYSIYLGSFKSTERAKKAINEYAENELDAYSVKLDFAEKGIWYRVYSGYYPDTESARAFIKENKINGAEIKNTAYSCFIDSFTDNETLENAINLIKEKQYSPYIITDHIDNVHFLFAGAFLTRSGAEKLSKELNAAGIENKVVSR